MPLKIEYHNPAYPKGMQFDLGGILVTNGETVDVDEDSELRFVSRRRLAVRDALQGNALASVSGDAIFPPSKVSELYPSPVAVVEEEAPATPENVEVVDDEEDDE